MKIYFSHNGGEDWDLVAITENDGKYNWDVPSINSKECLIKIENFDASLIGMSKKSFTIDGPEIKILSPTEEVVFSGGDKTLIVFISLFFWSSTTISVKVPPISADTLNIFDII